MANNHEFFEVGAHLRAILIADPTVSSITRKIFAVAIDEAKCPYIVYRRAGVTQTSVAGRPGPFRVRMEVVCYADNYPQSLRLAEAVTDALDGKFFEDDDWRMRRVTLIDSQEGWVADAWEQTLIFDISL